MPNTLPDCHLVRTAIPFLPHEDSLGDFHRSPSVSLASFADRVSEGDRGKALARAPPRSSSIHPPHARQATSTHSVTAPTDRCTALQVHNLFRTQAENTTVGVRLCTRTGLHENRVGLSMPLEIALSPQARMARFPPAPTQNWAYQAGTRGFIGVPFRGFLAPPSETDDLTRILRRRLAPYSISQI